MNNVMKAKGFQISGGDCYFTLEKPEWQMVRNVAVRKAEAVVKKSFPDPWAQGPFKCDWPSGSLWLVQPGSESLQLGLYNARASTWVWNSSAMARCGSTLEAVESAFAEAP
jgi:hypothetical protein